MRLLRNLCFLLMLAVFLPVQAWSEALVNSEADVDVSGKDAADARSQAMTKAQQDALVNLLNKFTTPEQTANILTTLDPLKIAGMVRGTQVLEEKISSNRYRARLLITFDGDQISALVGKNGTGPAGTEAPTVGSFLIIPPYEEDNESMLWDDNNAWRDAWKAVGLEITSGDIVVPYGDSTDSGVIDAKNASAATYASLAPLTVRYGTTDIVILQAKFTRNPDMVLNVVKRHLSQAGNEVNLLTYRADPQETKELLLLRAARDIAEQLGHKKTEELESVKIVRGGERNTVMLLASVPTLSAWTQMRGKLSKLPMVDQLETLAISPQQIDMLVHYRGSPDSLANAITSQNLRLVKNPTYWVVSRD